MNQRRICFVFSEINSSKTFELLVLEAAKEYQCRVYIYGNSDNILRRRLQEANIDTRIIHNRGNKLSFLKLCIRIFLIKANRSTCFFTSGLTATYALLLRTYLKSNYLWIYIRHHSDVHNGKSVYQILDKLCTLRASCVIAVSKIVYDLLLSLNFDLNRIALVHNGILLSENSLLRSRNYPKSTWQIGIVSRVEPSKGVEFSLQALIDVSNYIDFEIWHVGEIGRFSENYRNLIQDKSINNRYKHFSWQEDLSWFYSNIDILIHVPITSSSESFGMVYLEGIASGAICIFSRSGILNELSDQNNGIWIEVPCQNSQAISAALHSVVHANLTSPNVRERKVLLDNFDLEKTIKSYLSLISEQFIASHASSGKP